jgi:hypothetical protein
VFVGALGDSAPGRHPFSLDHINHPLVSTLELSFTRRSDVIDRFASTRLVHEVSADHSNISMHYKVLRILPAGQFYPSRPIRINKDLSPSSLATKGDVLIHRPILVA